jgi:radical SAM superfamily enzyme YgiQ (UPF0313 family)
MTFTVLLISTYEIGRQPFGLASPAAWLRDAGADVCCLDLSVELLNADTIRAADLIAFYLPMHAATRMAVPVIERVRQLNPKVHLCCFGLYAPMNASYLQRLGVDTVLGGEFETRLVSLVNRLSGARNGRLSTSNGQPEPLISLDRQDFRVPDRSGLPTLSNYASLVTADKSARVVGYTEASRGCKHLCRHCPIVPVYNGRFRIVQREVVLADVRQQVAAGAQHITFGDPDFFNGPGHAIPLVEALHAEFPHLTYDVTIKVEHLLKYAGHLATLKQTGCLFITSAVESFDEHILTFFQKHHTREDFESVLHHCRRLGLLLIPTFVAFTPWTTLEGYANFLAEIARLDLVEHVAPIQYTLRLLIPPGSQLLELPEMQRLIGELDEAKLSYRWQNSDPRVDQLQHELEYIVNDCTREQIARRETFHRIWQRTQQDLHYLEPVPFPERPEHWQAVPYLTEPWYC